ncbi:MAG: HAMP domain-containing histidine kinase [Bacteroidetes bacterium]|nr:HAMP domain-containing histidine kinase [Bacteroidota bacterium]
MLFKFNKYSYLIVAICFFVIAAIIENGLLKQHPEIHLVEDFQEDLTKNEGLLEAKLNEALKVISFGIDGDVSDALDDSGLFVEEEGFDFLVFQDGELKYWSDRSVAFFNKSSDIKISNNLVQLPNGFYLVKKVVKDNFEVVGLHLIKNNYPFENKYLQNTFSEDYDIPNDFEIKNTEIADFEDFWVKNSEGKFLFSLIPGGQFLCNTDQLYFPGVIYFIGLLLLLFYFRREFVTSKATFFLKLSALGTAIFIVYWLHIIFNVPKLFLHLQFFSPDYFAISNWLPSLGDYFLMTLFFLFWLYNFGSELNITQLQDDSKLPRKIIAFLLLLFSASLYLLSNYFIEQLIINSTISFSLNKIISITAQSVFGIFSVGLILFSILYFTVRIIRESSNDFSFKQLFGGTLLIVLFLSLVQFVAIGKVSVAALLMFVIVSALGWLLSKIYLHKFTLSYLIIFVSVASFYSLFVFYNTIGQKDRNIQKLLAVNLVAERDPAAEERLVDIQYELSKDGAIYSLLGQDGDIEEYIEKTYFNNYFRKYFIQVYVCENTDSLFLPDEKRDVLCLPFLDGLIQAEGDQIPGTDFYFMDNMNGRISYSGKINYPLLDDTSGVTIYIDLHSDLLFEGIGFPELLIDKTMARSDNYKKFDYAKYFGGELTDKYGEYTYNFHIDSYLEPASGEEYKNEEFSYKRWDKREHLIYHTHEHNFVIVSRPLFTVVDYLISFPYLFVFYFLSVSILIFVGNHTIRKRKVIFDLKFKIQAAIISIVFISLLGVAMATIMYNIEEYQSKHKEDLNEKMKSIAEEIDMRLEDKTEITDSLEIWLHRELAKLSNIFRTDINIYGDYGDLIASSRFEIFDIGLISTKMNARAYSEIYKNFQAGYSEHEDIGQLSYLSAYKPIINNYGDYLGFINLPYFIKQDNYSQEITTFVVAFINLYVLLFLASIIAAVFIANQITRPLVVIQENLKKMELGKHNEPIHYNRNDEIGSLVKEYNKKVDELAVSADLLARSERESAWREMAKQIAHEIKNPLTPMKLNIQYLQRTKGENPEYNKFLERVTGTLIEQIDNLSNIATEFSNFAKIPTARNQVFILAEQLQKVIDLYETHDRAQIEFNANGCDEIEVNADREQLSRAVINLIRNGIQSIPEEEIGRIGIWLERKNEKAIIAVKDNGLGISVDLRDKLFSPSFTTKTSGMGLGLAIVKNIVENFSGKIWFETELNKGTTFFLEIPVFEGEENG